MNTRRILVARARASDVGSDERCAFPTEREASFRFTQDDLLDQSPRYSSLYAALIDRMAARLAVRFGLTPEVGRLLARDAVPTITHLFLDRVLRLEGIVALDPAIGSVARGVSPLPVVRAEELRILIWRSAAFNQWMFERLAPLWELPVADRTVTDPPASAKSGINFNAAGRPLWHRVRRLTLDIAVRRLAKVSTWVEGSLPVLSMGYPTSMLQDRGFYWFGGLRDMRGRVVFDRLEPDQSLRDALLRPAVAEVLPLVTTFLEASGVPRDRAGRAAAAFAPFFVEMYPTDLLEGVPVHLPRVVAALQPFASRALISAESANVEVTYFVAAARSLGMQTLGFQQGGHYGYEDDLVAPVEMEYPFFQRFITWGWTRFPDTTCLEGIEAVPLPSPWLTERRPQWRRLLGDETARLRASKPYDLLFMSNKVYPFPPAPSGAAISRSDHIETFATVLRETIDGAAARGFRVLHKSYDTMTLELLEETVADLERRHAGAYARPKELHKGLTSALLSDSHVVLWDQPGTGFLECATSRIPTLILWPRFYNREVLWTRSLFERLEATGVVHRTVTSMLDEAARYKLDPVGWMNDPDRNAALAAFLQEYGVTAEDWPRSWRAFIKTLA